MSALQIQLERANYKPGEELRGAAQWHLNRPATRLELRLCWFTTGTVIPDSTVVETIPLPASVADDKRPFTFRLPSAPYSFFGSRSMLGWAVELIALPGNETARALFHLSPNGVPINLFASADEDEELTIEPETP